MFEEEIKGLKLVVFEGPEVEYVLWHMNQVVDNLTDKDASRLHASTLTLLEEQIGWFKKALKYKEPRARLAWNQLPTIMNLIEQHSPHKFDITEAPMIKDLKAADKIIEQVIEEVRGKPKMDIGRSYDPTEKMINSVNDLTDEDRIKYADAIAAIEAIRANGRR
jgi:hypothetical protein